jgi:hypothetical protein
MAHTRNLAPLWRPTACAFPARSGSTDDAANLVCSSGFQTPENATCNAERNMQNADTVLCPCDLAVLHSEFCVLSYSLRCLAHGAGGRS